MNIHDYMLDVSNIPKDLRNPDTYSFAKLLAMRMVTYQAFAGIEAQKSFLKPELSLAQAVGQDAIRVLFQRFLEEMTESRDAKTYPHQAEEGIDAINFLWSMLIIDPQAPIGEIFLEDLVRAWENSESGHYQGCSFSVEDLGIVVADFYPTFNKLRNRSWMSNPQSLYFDGWGELSQSVEFASQVIFGLYEDWDQFLQYYLAKDEVLHFRLESKY